MEEGTKRAYCVDPGQRMPSRVYSSILLTLSIYYGCEVAMIVNLRRVQGWMYCVFGIVVWVIP